ncbi:MAG: hypothetical protein Kow0089_03800 [Desulfobulbaceae bacterium]
MARAKKKKKGPKKTYRFQLTLPGIAGIAVVCFCLFLWMFLLGVWAGQTFLLPSAGPMASAGKENGRDGKQVETLVSTAKKKPSSGDAR